MLEITDLKGFRPFVRSRASTEELSARVKQIISDVAENGDTSLLALTKKFDGVRPASLRVPADAIQSAVEALDPRLKTIFEKAISSITQYHRRTGWESWQEESSDGSVLGMIVTPVDRAGIYIPGGKASYPSTAFMNIIPAQLAGVPSIAVVSPPDETGLPHPLVLAACGMLGIEEVYGIGGAQSVAALAYGTKTIRPVAKITGPGNQYVAEAKRQVSGLVGIDSIAGPSEIMILHDDPAVPPEYIARDMLAQAEHDEEAKCAFITTIPEAAQNVRRIMLELLDKIPRAEIIRAAHQNPGSICVCRSFAEGAALVNSAAPEHLEVLTTDESNLKLIRNAGAIFVGSWSGVAIGDYMAGPNHTLPTEGSGRFMSPLSVADFQKRSSLIKYSQIRLAEQAERIATFAEAEGLFAHAASMRARLD